MVVIVEITETMHTQKKRRVPSCIRLCIIKGIIREIIINMKFFKNICVKYLRAGKLMMLDSIFKLIIKWIKAGIEPTKYTSGDTTQTLKLDILMVD